MKLRTLSPALLLALLGSCIGGGDGAAGGATPPPGGGGGGPVVGGTTALSAPGITSVFGGAGTLTVSWTAVDSEGNDVPVGIFRSTSRAALFGGAPALQASQSGTTTFGGLTPNTTWYVGFARRTGPGQFEPTGPVVEAVTKAPIFVRAGADAATADGTTPATAFPHPFEGVLSAFAAGGGNVWISEGVYVDVNLPVFAGVHLAGGFEDTFNVTLRDTDAHETVLLGRLGLSVIEVQGSTSFASFDGLTVDGNDAAPVGIAVTDTPVGMRDVDVVRCSGRGIRIRNQTADRLESHLLDVRALSNGGDGLSGLGAFDFVIERCAFSSNLQEGIDFDDLVGLDGEDSSLTIHASRFFGNGTQGVDVDMVAPLAPGPLGSRFDIEVLGCAFEHNGEEGLLLDLDFDLVAGWSARLEVGHCESRANRGHGIHLDMDGDASASVHHCVSTANGGDGISVTSETTPALVVVSSSAFSGNLGRGVTASLGNAPILMSHCVVTGNALGGALSTTVESSAVSCVLHEQPVPLTGFRGTANVVTSTADAVFADVPESWRTATALQGDRLTVVNAGTITPGSLVQLAGDGVARTVLSVEGGTAVRLDTVPAVFQAPARVAVFAPGSGGSADYALPPGSPALGAGLAAPGDSADAGPLGAPGGIAPGLGRPVVPATIRLASVVPSSTALVPAGDTVSIEFTGTALAAGSVTSASVRAVGNTGNELVPLLMTVGDTILVAPPVGGWPSGLWTLELHRTLASTQGDAFATPLILPMRTP